MTFHGNRTERVPNRTNDQRGHRRRAQGVFGRAVSRLLLIGGILALVGLPALAGGDWNDEKMSWQSYEKGLAAAKAQKKPVCLIFYTEWCPHCTKYSSVFHDAKVVDRSKSFIMVRLDKDKNKELSKQYSPDGEYIPRTYFLSPDGKLDPEIQGPNKNFKYFYDESAPASILGGMDQALTKLH